MTPPLPPHTHSPRVCPRRQAIRGSYENAKSGAVQLAELRMMTTKGSVHVADASVQAGPTRLMDGATAVAVAEARLVDEDKGDDLAAATKSAAEEPELPTQVSASFATVHLCHTTPDTTKTETETSSIRTPTTTTTTTTASTR